MVGLRQLLEEMVNADASDLHLTVGSPPVIRVDGKLLKMAHDPLTPETTKKLAYSIMSEKQRLKFENNSEITVRFPNEAGIIQVKVPEELSKESEHTD